ncbi:MAG: hypothetical protein ACE10B_08325, partial [Phycisphaerales bacterium]
MPRRRRGGLPLVDPPDQLVRDVERRVGVHHPPQRYLLNDLELAALLEIDPRVIGKDLINAVGSCKTPGGPDNLIEDFLAGFRPPGAKLCLVELNQSTEIQCNLFV